MKKLIQNISVRPWLAYLFAVLAGVIYFFTALDLAHHTTSFLDEGLYTYKGWLFATGKYSLFEYYGLRTNHMPLAFLIPGYVQKWFGPGLRTARYFMILMGLFTQLGLWIVVKRWSNRWWAAGAALAFALNPASIKLYTLSISQGLVAFFLVWMFAIFLKESASLWRVLLGAVMASLIILTRLNMSFILPIFILYIFWEFGLRVALLSTGLSALVLLGVHAFFYPGIIDYWAYWLPEGLTPFLNAFRLSSDAPLIQPPPSAEVVSAYRVFLYLFLALRLHFIALFSAISTWLLFPRIRKFTPRIRAAIFLSVLLIVLFGAHAMNTFSDDRCVSCILLYTAYFDFIGLLLLPLAYPFLKKELRTGRIILIFSVVVITILGLGFSAYEDVSLDFAHQVIPYIRDMYLWSAMLHVTQIEALVLFRIVWLALIVGFALVALTVFFITKGRRQPASRKYFGNWVLMLLLSFALLLAPTKAFGKGNDFFNCGENDVIARYEKAGTDLQTLIPPGSQVYWSGRIDAIFLSLPDVEIYPPQLNQIHSYYISGDADALLKYGFWNNQLANEWLYEADYILNELGSTLDFEQEAFDSGAYEKIGATGSIEKCREWQSVIEVYERVDK